MPDQGGTGDMVGIVVVSHNISSAANASNPTAVRRLTDPVATTFDDHEGRGCIDFTTGEVWTGSYAGTLTWDSPVYERFYRAVREANPNTVTATDTVPPTCGNVWHVVHCQGIVFFRTRPPGPTW